MTPKPRNEAAVNALRMMPTKWAIVIVGVVIAYVVLQPRLNQWFGWSLPSVASMVGDEKTVAKTQSKRGEASKKSAASQQDKVKETQKSEEAAPKNKPNEVDEEPVEKETPTLPHGRRAEDSKPTSPTKTTSKPKGKSNDDSEPLYGFLTEVGRNRYESPAGLVYGPGSEEGHRLKHIARHLEDQPDRPGSHGVFNGDMKAFLAAIDDAYTRAKKGAKGTSKKDDDGSVVYEVTFEKAIGFIGGESGGRKRNPSTKKIRLVVRGNNVITAFPF